MSLLHSSPRSFRSARVMRPLLSLVGALLFARAIACVGDDPLTNNANVDAGGSGADGEAEGASTDDAPSDTSSGNDANTVIAPADPVAIGAGHAHVCVVLARGDVLCWGKNEFGETGETPGGSLTTLTPHVVAWIGSGSPSYAQVSAALDHTCAADATGSVYCWGRNDGAELGSGSIDDAGSAANPTPKNAVNENAIFFKVKAARQSLVARAHYTCGLKANGTVACWGSSEAPLDNNGGPKRSARSVDVQGLAPDTSSMLVGGVIHNCVASGQDATKPVKCWGGNKFSQLGDGNANDYSGVSSAIWPSGVPAPTQLVSGLGHNCALAGGAVYCWGYNGVGATGLPSAGTNDLLSLPTRATSFETAGEAITAIAAGGSNTCVVRAGKVYCVGANESGQLGTASSDDGGPAHSTPNQVLQIDDAVDVAVGGMPYDTGFLPVAGGFACAIRQDKATHRRTVWCWGANDRGQLGTGAASTFNAAPVQVKGLPTQ
jgi:alpha-tubulin suppressor-like RCC1 family protein